VTGVRTRAGAHFEADAVVVAAGAWTPRLVPQLGPYLSSVAQPVLYFRASDTARYRPPCLGVWAADIATTGWYGFPARSDGTFKVARHDLGYDMDPDAARVPLPQEEDTFRAFLAGTFPGLADAPLIAARLCLYCDTADGNFWIGADPERRGLVVASGGSGHAFKFAPLVGDWVASAVEGNPDPATRPFAWRNPRPGQSDQARCPQRKGPGPSSLSTASPLH
jgi:glycine/D-amino acid oxidase-like deaminating enzyme